MCNEQAKHKYALTEELEADLYSACLKNCLVFGGCRENAKKLLKRIDR